MLAAIDVHSPVIIVTVCAFQCVCVCVRACLRARNPAIAQRVQPLAAQVIDGSNSGAFPRN